jgi:glycosyltransferase involved in cell wall biosynthesis
MISALTTRPADAPSEALSGKRLLFVLNVDWFFTSHYLGRARAAQQAGAEIHVACGMTQDAERLRQYGFRTHRLTLSRSGTLPWNELSSFAEISSIVAAVSPHLIHLVTPKVNLYGALVGRYMYKGPVVCSLSGMGYVFADAHRSGFLKTLLRRLYRVALRNERSYVIFQNRDDRNEFLRMGLLTEDRAFLVKGAGVDCTTFLPAPPPPGKPIVLLASRMLWDKGVGEFVRASRILTRAGVEARFVLAGAVDGENPAGIPESQLRHWAAEGCVEWWGHRSDMNEVLQQSSIVVLPSYREGMPKVLLEAAATGRAMIAADVQGCREIVQDGVNGILVPVKDAAGLARAVLELVLNPRKRSLLGEAARRIAEAEFSAQLVEAETVAIYEHVLRRPSTS